MSTLESEMESAHTFIQAKATIFNTRPNLVIVQNSWVPTESHSRLYMYRGGSGHCQGQSVLYRFGVTTLSRSAANSRTVTP